MNDRLVTDDTAVVVTEYLKLQEWGGGGGPSVKRVALTAERDGSSLWLISMRLGCGSSTA